MDVADVMQRVERVAVVRADSSASAELAATGLVDITDIRAWLDSSEAALSKVVAAASSFPEAAISETSRGSLNGASKTLERAESLDAMPSMAEALDDAAVTAAHVDVVTRASKSLEPEQVERLFDKVDGLVDVATTATVAEFARRVRSEAAKIAADDGVSRFERQQRATTLSTWVDPEGMWNLRGRFDPVTGLKLASKIEATVETLFAEATPATCPSDPVEKQKHLRALSLAHLVDGANGGGRRPRAEFVAVIDVAAAPTGSSAAVGGGRADESVRDSADEAADEWGAAGPDVQWPIPIEVPARVLADMVDQGDVHTVVVRNGVVLHAPGELNLGRTTRLANRAQRRALRGLYRDCAIPGCQTSYDRCKLHHIVWWRNGGRTDLDNLIPVCSHHHHKIHDDGWNIALGPNRELTLTLPDGNVRNTGPPRRRAA